jgi:hypothetical protein
MTDQVTQVRSPAPPTDTTPSILVAPPRVTLAVAIGPNVDGEQLQAQQAHDIETTNTTDAAADAPAAITALPTALPEEA